MQTTHVFTSAALNYIPKVRMLFRSLREHHPEWRLHLALADDLPTNIDLSNEPFDEVTAVDSLDIPSWRGWAFCHSIVELATAIKPFMLARLLNREDAGRAIYLDPDIVVFSRLDDIVAALEESNILLTPHVTVPEDTLDAVIDNEIGSLKHGIYNLGFIAVAANDEGRKFADWWGKRIYHFCRADIPNGLFTDQRWIDLVPAFFDGVAIMKSARHNVATWNLTTRELSRDRTGSYFVEGFPLGFYHFTGFDSGAHHVMAEKNAPNNFSVQELIKWYGDQTSRAAGDPLATVVWAFGHYSDGSAITRLQRLVYRERIDLQVAFPDPFDASGYSQWWKGRGNSEYPEFFEAQPSGAAQIVGFGSLTPGFRPKSDELKWSKVRGNLRKALTRPTEGIRLGKKGFKILRSAGIEGLKRHLQ